MMSIGLRQDTRPTLSGAMSYAEEYILCRGSGEADGTKSLCVGCDRLLRLFSSVDCCYRFQSVCCTKYCALYTGSIECRKGIVDSFRIPRVPDPRRSAEPAKARFAGSVARGFLPGIVSPSTRSCRFSRWTFAAGLPSSLADSPGLWARIAACSRAYRAVNSAYCRCSQSNSHPLR